MTSNCFCFVRQRVETSIVLRRGRRKVIREKMKMSFLLSIVFLLLLQSSFAAENPTHEGKDGLNHEFTVAQFSRVA